jgi:hypothetical protein
LFRQQTDLIRSQATLQQQLSRLQGKDPQTRAEWQDLFNRLYGGRAGSIADISSIMRVGGAAGRVEVWESKGYMSSRCNVRWVALSVLQRYLR